MQSPDLPHVCTFSMGQGCAITCTCPEAEEKQDLMLFFLFFLQFLDSEKSLCEHTV